MKCQTLETFQPFLSFVNGFDKKKGHKYVSFDARPEVQKHSIGG